MTRGLVLLGVAAGMLAIARPAMAAAPAANAPAANAPAANAPAAAPRATPVPRPEPGDVIPEFETVGIDGKPLRVEFGKGSKTVLLFFQAGCPHCHRMIPEWNRAYQQKAAGLKVYGIMLDKEPPGFFILMPIEFPVLRPPSRQILDQIKAFKVPTAVRVLAGGKVEDVAQGEADRMRIAQIFKP